MIYRVKYIFSICCLYTWECHYMVISIYVSECISIYLSMIIVDIYLSIYFTDDGMVVGKKPVKRINIYLYTPLYIYTCIHLYTLTKYTPVYIQYTNNVYMYMYMYQFTVLVHMYI